MLIEKDLITKEELCDVLKNLISFGARIKELDTFITPTNEEGIVVVVEDDLNLEESKNIALRLKTKRPFVISKRFDNRLSLINPFYYSKRNGETIDFRPSLFSLMIICLVFGSVSSLENYLYF